MEHFSIADLSLNDKKGVMMEVANHCNFEICFDDINEEPKSNTSYCNVFSSREENIKNGQESHSSSKSTSITSTPLQSDRKEPFTMLQSNDKRSSLKDKCFSNIVPKSVKFSKHIEIREYYCPKENRTKKVTRRKKKGTRSP